MTAVTGEGSVSRETSDRLRAFLGLVEKWNPAINLVSRTTLPEAWTRHILDSAQLFDLAPPDARHWADLGSGGGFPGLVIAILAVDAAPQLRVTLVESDQRKATFLRQAAQLLKLEVQVHATRIEDLPPLDADVVSARALAPLPRLCALVHRHIAEGGLALLPKGANHAAELVEASQDWSMAVDAIRSRTDPAGVILRVKGLARV